MLVSAAAVNSGLEYKFLVKSVDPDGTVSSTESKNSSDQLLSSNELYEEWEEYEDGEMFAPAIPEGRIPNRTGNLHEFSGAHQHEHLLVCRPSPHTLILPHHSSEGAVFQPS